MGVHKGWFKRTVGNMTPNRAFEPRNLGVFVCSHVLKRERPILLVSHDDGDWQCLCGGSDHGDDAHLVGVGHLIDDDPSLNECADLPGNWCAERDSPGATWRRSKL